MKSDVGIAYSKSDWIAVRNLTKIMEMQKSEQNAKITHDFHSTEKIINLNWNKFEELKTNELTQTLKRETLN